MQSSICWLKKLHLQNDFERFMIDDTREDLKHWCFRNHVSQNDLKNCMKYVENVGDRSEEKGKLQVMTCITDPYGNPYIRKFSEGNATNNSSG